MPRKFNTNEEKNAYQRAYYAKRKAEDPNYVKITVGKTVAANNARYRFRNTEILNEFRKNGCKLCGEMNHACLQAHHLDPLSKYVEIGRIKTCSENKFRQELSKCVCLCANCHFKLHAGVLAL